MKLQELLKTNDHWNYYGIPGTHGTDKNTGHSYISNFYEDAFAKYKDKPITLLEIGIARGDSLLLWDSYFVNNTGIYGVDNYDMISLDLRKNTKIQKFFTDAYSEYFSKMLPSFDIIIDDGPHSLDSQKKAIELYLGKVNPGGIFVIEDIQEESSISVLKDTVPEHLKEYCSFIDLRSVKGRNDDMMFVVQLPGE